MRWIVTVNRHLPHALENGLVSRTTIFVIWHLYRIPPGKMWCFFIFPILRISDTTQKIRNLHHRLFDKIASAASDLIFERPFVDAESHLKRKKPKIGYRIFGFHNFGLTYIYRPRYEQGFTASHRDGICYVFIVGDLIEVQVLVDLVAIGVDHADVGHVLFLGGDLAQA